MSWSCSDLHAPTPNIVATKTGQFIIYILLALCWLTLRFSSTLLHDARLTGLIYPVISFAFFRNSGKTLAFL